MKEIQLKDLKHSIEQSQCYERTDGTQGVHLVQIMLDDMNNILKSMCCGTCKFWVRSNKNETLKCCTGDNGCAITGHSFYCSNWERIKNG